MSHTPTPWKAHVDRRWINGSCLIYTAIVPTGDTEGLRHLKMADGNHHVCRMSHTYKPEVALMHWADAEFIVKAVNAHDDLVAALKAAEELYHVGIINAPDGLYERVQDLRKIALAKAGALCP